MESALGHSVAMLLLYLSRIPLELDVANRVEVSSQQSPVGFQDCGSSRTIIISTLTGVRENLQRD